MADSAVLDPPAAFLPPPSPLHHDLFSDLCFDGDLHFSIDDLLDFPDSPRRDSATSSSSSPTHANSSDSAAPPPLSPPDPGSRRRRDRDEPDAATEARSCRPRRSPDDESCLFQPGGEEDERRRARLMRNRESAQLSRQRKKHYVEELEEKVRSMHSTIADLNSRIGFFAAENARLRQQLGAPPPVLAPVPFPWFPPGYAVKPPGVHVPLVPIPRLKPQQAPAKAKKGEGGKVKKVAGVSLLGLLFLMLVAGGFDLGHRSASYNRYSHGRVLTDIEPSPDHRLLDHRRRDVTRGADRSGENASGPPLLASLYIPRNDRVVKIDGNLIISSVLASEKAMDHRSPKEEAAKRSDLAVKGIPPEMASLALAVGNSGRRHTAQYAKASVGQKALPSGSRDLQDWFREGLEGPIFSSGMCTEVFQFDASQDNGNADTGGVVSATSIANSTKNLTESTSYSTKLKNRRILCPEPMPLNGTALNDTKRGNFNRSQESKSTQSTSMRKSMVVSILVDPREVGDGSDTDGMMPPRTVSRIFVVVLVDEAKYVTYSCMLPFKSNSQPLVTA